MDVGVDGMLTMGVWYGMIMIMMVGGWVVIYDNWSDVEQR